MFYGYSIPPGIINYLRQVEITISAPFLYEGDYWNPGETAYVNVRLRNNSLATFKDIVLRLNVSGKASIDTMRINEGIFDNEAWWSEVKPFETKIYTVPIIAGEEPGTVYFWVSAWADLIPSAYLYSAANRQASVRQRYD